MSVRRREKRRHGSNASSQSQGLPSGFRDPRFVLQMAVRMDESLGSTEFLEEPLRFYGDIDDFKRAVAILTKGERKHQPALKTALTPIILSGLLAAQQAREQEGNKGSDITENWPTASELVSYCTTIRKQALLRIARKKRKRKLRLFAVVAGLGFVCGAAYYHTISSMEQSMIELSYTVIPSDEKKDEFSSGLVPCSWMESSDDENACRAAEANLWAHFRDYASEYSAKLRDCTRRRCSRDSRNIMRRQLSSIHGRSADLDYAQGPYAMHTIAVREAIVLKTAHSKTSFEPWWVPSEDDGKFRKGLQWLGDTTINHMVRKRLMGKMKKDKSGSKGSFRVLDVGCGIGGTLYSLAGAAEDRWNEDNEYARVEYLGIAISSAEVMNARRLAAEHDMDLSRSQFQQLSFDSPSLRENGKFSAAVAIESLSFSRNISNTLSNLASVIRSGGTLVVVDDVASAQYGEFHNDTEGESLIESYSALASRPSLLTHSEWKEAFGSAGFVMTEAMDIGLQFILPQLVKDGSSKQRRTSFRDWLLRLTHGSKKRSIFLRLLQKCEAWKQSRLGNAKTEQVNIRKLAELQALQLMQQNINFIRSKMYRKEAHEHLELTYNLYVCTRR